MLGQCQGNVNVYVIISPHPFNNTTPPGHVAMFAHIQRQVIFFYGVVSCSPFAAASCNFAAA